MKQRRALILYGSMTHNTEKIAIWFAETFRAYNWDVNVVKLLAPSKMAEQQQSLYFDDYDVVALGSPIVGGAPIQNVIRNMSMGAGGTLEKEVQVKLDKKTGNAAAAAYAPSVRWRRGRAPYDGVLNRGEHRPLGIVFSTYGGGFYGSGECIPVLESLKLYLTCNNVDVVGKFCCAGKETGPAGFAVGVKPPAFFMPGPKGKDAPLADVQDAIIYKMADGTEKPGSYFFHYDLESKPGYREEMKARFFVSDFIEDYFMTYDGTVNLPLSEIISMS